MSEVPTNEERMKVLRYECKLQGHVLEVVQAAQSDGPSLVICARCGKSWRVEDDPDGG